MVLRTALGALVVIAVLAAVALMLPERRGRNEAGTKAPFGALVTPPPPVADVQASLLKFASLSNGLDARAAASQPALVASGLQPAPPVVAAEPQRLAADDTPPVGEAEPTPPTAAPATARDPASQPQAVAIAADPPQASSPADTSTGLDRNEDGSAKANGTININTASIEALDHLPGAGHIGRAIARRRPYRSVEDLVAKRVLRDTAFQRIRPLISVN